jgi:hypothetical protein
MSLMGIGLHRVVQTIIAQAITGQRLSSKKPPVLDAIRTGGRNYTIDATRKDSVNNAASL